MQTKLQTNCRAQHGSLLTADVVGNGDSSLVHADVDGNGLTDGIGGSDIGDTVNGLLGGAGGVTGGDVGDTVNGLLGGDGLTGQLLNADVGGPVDANANIGSARAIR